MHGTVFLSTLLSGVLPEEGGCATDMGTTDVIARGGV